MKRDLTEPQRRMLANIARVVDEYDGIAPQGAGQFRTIRALEQAGLVKWVGPGECGDGCERAGDCPHLVRIYTLSDAGHRYLDEQERAA